MSKRERDAVATILIDPENEARSPDEVAAAVIEALDDVRARHQRFAVVGQIAFNEAPGTVHTVVLGPFSARGILDSQAKLLRALAGPSSARNAGQDLYVDPKTRTGKGRFMLAPAFQSARAAWEFFRPAEPEVPKRFAWIAESILRWEAGPYGPVCHCGAHREVPGVERAGGPCPIHGEEYR